VNIEKWQAQAVGNVDRCYWVDFKKPRAQGYQTDC
jgi:hypothetical protein